MVATTLLFVAASSILPSVLGLPLRGQEQVVKRYGSSYTDFGGDGTVAKGWPAQDTWMKFDDAWKAHASLMTSSCGQWGVPNTDAEKELPLVKKAIEEVAKAEPSLPAEFLLAIMVQESKGCIRAPTTVGSVSNPGLFQTFKGEGSCNKGAGQVTTPCPEPMILKMVQEGAGIGREFGLKQAITQCQSTGIERFYKAARIYNSGSIDPSGNLGLGGATHCYASDVANRLLGVVFDMSPCNPNSIGQNQGSTGPSNPPSNPPTTPTVPTPSSSAAPVPTSTSSSAPAPTLPPTPPTVPTPSSSSTPVASSTSSSTPAPTLLPTPPTNPTPPTSPQPPANGQPVGEPPKDDGMGEHYPFADKNCKTWHAVKEGDHCSNIPGVSFEALQKFNAGLDVTCSNLWKGYAYCTAC